MAATREQIILTMCDLLETQGYHATGLNQVVKESGSPKGSLYYYFPDGKDGLTAEAVERTGTQVAQHIRQALAAHEDAAAAVRDFVLFIATQVEASGFRAGGPLTTVAMETATSNARLNEVCRRAYEGLEAAFAAKLITCRYPEERAHELAIFIVAAMEGGIILSRTWHSGDPLRRVAHELAYLLAHEQPS